MSAIGNQKKAISRVNQLKTSIDSNNKSLVEARERSRNLLREIKNSSNPTKKLRNDYDQARRAVDRLESSQKKYRLELARKLGKLKEAGVNTRKLTEEQRKLGNAYQETSNKIKNFSNQQAQAEKLQQVRSQRLERAAHISLVAGGVDRVGRVLTGALSKPVSHAINFESAIADVRKVVDFESPEGFQNLSNKIIEMTKTIPLAKEQLNQSFSVRA